MAMMQEAAQATTDTGPEQAPAEQPGPEANESASPETGAEGGEEATPEEQAAYEEANVALHKVLYENEKTSQAVVDMLQPEAKVDSTVKATVLLVKQLDEKIDIDESAIAQITMDTADRLMELGEQVKGFTYSEQEAQAVAGAAWEGVMQMFGVDEEQYQQLMGDMSPEEVRRYEDEYNNFLGAATQGAQQNG